MNKWIAVLLTLMLLTVAAAPAIAEQNALTLEGFVTELVEGGFIMEDVALGQIMLNTDETTVWDGILQEEAVAAGQYVFVQYDGKTTRSIPPQAHADKVGCYVLNGTAGEFLQEGVLLTGDELFGDVIVRLDSTRWHVFPGVPMTVYYNGVMAMSLPGQVGASAVIVPELEGTVSEQDDGGFTLTDDEGHSFRVELDASTLITEQQPVTEEGTEDESADVNAEPGTEPDTDDKPATDSLANADWTIDVDDPETAEAIPMLTPQDIAAGDRVCVYFSGEYLSDDKDALLALEALILRP